MGKRMRLLGVTELTSMLAVFALGVGMMGSVPARAADSCSSQTFNAKVDYGVGIFPSGDTAGDFNGDGKPDLAVANQKSNTVSVLLNKGDGTFNTAVNYSVGIMPSSVTMGDFNGDLKPDLAVANYTSNNVSVLLNKGDGTFNTAVNYGGSNSPNGVATADFNGDGKPDLVTANFGSNAVSVLLNKGDGTFNTAVNYGASVNPVSVATGDFNGDDKPDLVVSNQTANTVSVLLNKGDGTFNAAVDYGVGNTPGSVAAGDLNGDGYPDLAVTNFFSNNVSVLLNKGDGTFNAKVDYGVGSAPGSVAAGDFDGDGKLDLAVANFNATTVSVLPNAGSGTFYNAVNYTVDTSPSSVTTADFNGDGKLDLAVANAVSDTGTNAVPSTVSVLLNAGRTGIFGSAASYSAGKNPHSVASADFNGDSKPDLVTANSGDNNVSVLLNYGDGTFNSPVNYAVGSSPQSVATGDFNGDLKPDLAVTNGSSSSVSVLLNKGDGTFNVAVNYDVGVNPVWVMAEDIDGNGKPDLVVVNQGSNTVSVLLNKGDGTFNAKVDYGAGGDPRSVAAGDFDGDHKPDLAVANANSTNVSVLLNKGDGTFNAAVAFNVRDGRFYSYGPIAVKTGDFNGDGKTDLVSVNFYSCDVSVLMGKGDRTFNTAVNYTPHGSFDYPQSMTTGDFNGDGKPDLAVTNGSSTVSVLLNNGDGTFAAALQLGVGTDPSSVATGDFDGDGKLDLAVANNYTGNVSVLLNAPPFDSNCDGTADLPTRVTLAASPVSSFQGQTATFTATVRTLDGSGPAPTGFVVFKDGAKTLGTGTLNLSATSISVAVLGLGSHTITAKYVGDDTKGPSVSLPLTFTVAVPTFAVSDAWAAIPASGTSIASFTVTFPLPQSQSVSIPYATQVGGPHPGVDGIDFQGIAGTLTFNPGDTSKTIPVTIPAHAVVGKTFLLLLNSTSPSLPISDNTGVGTLMTETAPGGALISEFRFIGPNGVTDQFVELYNNSDNPLTVATRDGSAGWALRGSDGLIRFTVPSGTILPSRGHFLGADTLSPGYSLSSLAAPDIGFTSALTVGGGIALFRSAASVAAGDVLDAAGYSSAPSLYREGNGFDPTGLEANFYALQYSFFRDTSSGVPQDTNDNLNDFLGVSVTGDRLGTTGHPSDPGNPSRAGQRLGSPGPENLSSPLPRNSRFLVGMFAPNYNPNDPTDLNRTVDYADLGPNNLYAGSIILRRSVKNVGSVPITQLQLRVSEVTTFPTPTGTSEVETTSFSSDADETLSGKTVYKTKVQAVSGGGQHGGGYNSVLLVPSVTVANPIPVGGTVFIEVKLYLTKFGSKFDFAANFEALP